MEILVPPLAGVTVATAKAELGAKNPPKTMAAIKTAKVDLIPKNLNSPLFIDLFDTGHFIGHFIDYLANSVSLYSY